MTTYQKTNKFKAIQTEEIGKGFISKVVEREFDGLPEGDLLIKVNYSSLNYKDALSATGNRGVTKKFPHTPGIDAVGIVESSNRSDFKAGTNVIVTGYDLGMNTSGGFSEYIKIPAEWAIKLPDGLTYRDSMILGTAGLTAGLCVQALEKASNIEGKKAVVTGATGGVGCIAVQLLAQLGAEVTAITGKDGTLGFLTGLGAAEVLQRDQFKESTRRQQPLSKGLWDLAVDVAGGDLLTSILASMKYSGVVTCCGLVGGTAFETSIFPFILRGISLIGIDSVEISLDKKVEIWNRFSTDWKLDNLEGICREVDLVEMLAEIDSILEGGQIGRVILKP